MIDHYKILGIKRGVSDKEISAAYRTKALLFHPDKRKKAGHLNSNLSEVEADEMFLKIKTSYQILQDPKSRAELDLKLIGEEERKLRDSQMSAKRRQLKEDLLASESLSNNNNNNNIKSSTSSTAKSTENSSKKGNVNLSEKEKKLKSFQPTNSGDSCLILKCKLSPQTRSVSDMKEMIKNVLSSSTVTVTNLHILDDFHLIAEFQSPQDAFNAHRRVPHDMIIKSDWFLGYPPANVQICVPTEETEREEKEKSNLGNNKKSKYSADFESSVLERLKQMKKKQQQ